MTEAATDLEDNPFPGLRPFKDDEAHLFFGRENQVDAMIDKLAQNRFLAVIGGSGSGKSSLVNCGLRPALSQGLMAQAGTAWRMAQFRPGNDPIGSMARALARDGVLFKAREQAALTTEEIVETTLRMSRLGLIDIYEQAALGEGVNLLVIADQFEELFRYRQLASGVRVEDAAAFVNLLLEVKAHPGSRIFVVLTMRSDFLGDCTHFPGLAEAINAGQYLVPRLTRDERRAAIECPIRVGGAQISPVLLTRLVNDVGDNPDQLSILQHALNRTWAYWRKKTGGKGLLDLEHYEAIGTMDHALDQHADQAYEELTERQKQIAEKLFKALTDKANDARGVRRPTTLGTLCKLAEATREEVASVIEVFREPSRSFLMPPAGDPLIPETVVDISHESLMRVWQRLKDWANEEVASSRIYLDLAKAAEDRAADKRSLWRDPELQLALDWQEKNGPNQAWASRYHRGFAAAQQFLAESRDARAAEQAERQRLRQFELQAEKEKAAAQARYARLMGGAAIFGFGLAMAAGLFWWQAREASDEAKENLKQAQITQSRWLINRAETATDQSERILLALEALPTAGELAPETLPNAEKKKIRPLFSKAHEKLFTWLDDFRHPVVVSGHDGSINSVAMTADGSRIVSGSDDETVGFWDAKVAELIKFKGHSAPVRSVAITPGGNRIVSGSDDKTVRVWDPKGTELKTLTGHSETVKSVAVTLNGKHIVSGSADKTARLWDADTGDTLKEFTDYGGAVDSVAITPNGRFVVTGSSDGAVRRWDATEKTELLLTQDGGAITSVAVTPNGERIVAAASDGIVRLWKAGSEKKLTPVTRRTDRVFGVALTRGGSGLVTVAEGRVRLWDLHENELLQMGRDNDTTLLSVAVTQDEAHIVTGSDDNKIRLWDKRTLSPDLASPQSLAMLVELSNKAVPRCLTIKERLDGALSAAPPSWCIDLKKSPYDTRSWRDFIAGKTVKDAEIVTQYANPADTLLKSGDFDKALEASDFGMKFLGAVEPGMNLDDMPTWIVGNKAHALMFLGKIEEACKTYLDPKYRGMSTPLGPWEKAIPKDFDLLRREGRSHPLMDLIAKAFYEPVPPNPDDICRGLRL